MNDIVKAIGYAFLVYACALFLSLLDENLFGASDVNANQASINTLYEVAPIPAILLTCLVAPIIEEFIFRYFIFKPISKKSTVLAFIVTGLTFGLIHMISTFSSFIETHDTAVLLNDLRSLVQYVAAGLLFAYIYHKTHKLYMNILAHMFYNTIVTVIMFVYLGTIPAKITNIQTSSDSVSFQLNVNQEYSESFNVTEVKIYDDDNLISHSLEGNQSVYTVNGLVEDTKYNIKVTYTYETYNVLGELEEVEESITTYVYTY